MHARHTLSPTRSRALGLAFAASLLAGCGGGGDDPPPAALPAAALKCETTHYVPGSVEAASDAQLAAYAGTYDGDEGSFGPNIGDPFVKSGSATMAFKADASFSYKGTTYAVSSVCVDKVANGTGSKFLYVEAGKGTMDITDKATAHGFSPADGMTLFQNGVKK